MWDFFKKIFSKKDREVTVVILDDTDPDTSSSFNLRATEMIKVALIVVVISALFTTLIFFVTPLGSLYQQQQDKALRQEVLDITEKVMALRDSLHAQDQQLFDLKEVLMRNPDTTFSPRFSVQNDLNERFGDQYRTQMRPENIQAFEMMSQNEIIFSDILKNVPDFPTFYPVEGNLTQKFSTADDHYGIDLAAKENTEFRVIADGTVVNAGWTINYGYVIYVQHGNGYMSVYKHGARLYKKNGDIVLKGDILGTVGDTGVLSFGSHLHFEIWKNGVAQDPLMYLIK
ncbi:MAG: M23 family metallopeptidase [Balneolaceae bacterium]